VTPFDLAGILRANEAMLVAALGLEPLPLPRELAAMDGEWKGEAVRMRARAYAGARIRYARFVAIESNALEIVNMLCLSRPEWPLPILGVDLVDLGRGAAVAAADLSPATPEHPAPEMPRAPSLISAGELPGWCARWFSPHALFARVPPGERAALAERIGACCRVFAETAAGAERHGPSAAAVAARQAAYAEAHLEEDRGLQLLTRMFDPQLATRFLREVLFPVKDVTWA
jgi:phycocyanobilin:ferredoxin oxidoreductase